ncbi:sigma-E processing peptidase SpoIIGA [Lysinibacillus sp. FSL M8-0216]|uniref:Stage II sporulation protein GA (Sporulation sigma-E factor processing peptidase) n=1 Tax=Lysinibacillus fusiformis TaxID=28031 RepID=A0A1H9DIL8_9BACI|nr:MULTISPECIES: sigma-E processing peptidase SpoIIGA [Lysinibacillus]MED4668550.1 sigma-E processing peptidase SpoIIGA [Lysinibacillus fusiformis]PCD83641.1 sporulation protein [Lysinibacillus fusiformis]QAS58938.1 sporulation protein [Lysinibacillus sphaericus]RDV29618.1 sporulation protein [Lysinibacillus fusiformis]SCX48166.1 stage II sporulation protein GA (sporulation sigma-E factor processing peptidase) [Lysinibacillus fusiformis]
MYGEWLVLINTLFNLAILTFTARVTGVLVKNSRLLMSSFCSSLVAVIGGQMLWTTVLSFILLIGIAFRFRIRSFQKQGPIVLTATIVIGGLLTALQPFLKNLSATHFIMICFVLAVLNLVAFYKQWGFVKLERLSGQFVFDTTLKIFGAIIPLSAFVDTGNQAIEPLSGKPVHFVSYTALSPHLPADFRKSLIEWQETDPYNVSMFSEDYQRYIRFIHINTVQQQTVVLGFRFDEWLIKGEPSQVKSNEYIVLTKKAKNFPHSTAAILHFSALSNNS